ncbi:hypothetical protein AAVH_16262 [Aphelenchoides avenae]|nr:hypothetical protein AAVH_16262 [Aphelenchus avenae]
MGYILGLFPHEKVRRVENRFVGSATFVRELIERFKLLYDTSNVFGSLTLPTEVFGVYEVFKRPADDVQVTVEPDVAPDVPTTSSAACRAPSAVEASQPLVRIGRPTSLASV